MNQRNPSYLKQLTELGFYVEGRPIGGTLAGDALRNARQPGMDARQIDRSFKYNSVLAEDKLGVTDIYELDGSACIYFKSVGSEPTEDQVAHWQRAAWNHGLARMLWVCTPTEIRVFNAFAPPPERPGRSQVARPAALPDARGSTGCFEGAESHQRED